MKEQIETLSTKCKYYIKLDASCWKPYQINGMIKHQKFGYVIPTDNIDNILKHKKIDINIWPDNDSYNFWETYDVEKIFVEKRIYGEINL